MLKIQSELSTMQEQLASGRSVEGGLAQGREAGFATALHQRRGYLETIIVNNGVLSARLGMAQQELNGLVESAHDVIRQLPGMASSDQGAAVGQALGQKALAGLIDGMSTTFNGEYIFGGDNVGMPPLKPYVATPVPSASKSSVDAAFQTAFGFPISDPAVANITQTQMEAFIDGAFSSLFESPSWEANWSNASTDHAIRSIGPDSTINVRSSANSDGVRMVAKGAVLLTELSSDKLSSAAFDVVINRAMQVFANSAAGIGDEQAAIGFVEGRVSDASDRLTWQSNTIEKHLVELERVDPAELATRISSLLTQIEATYSVTARISRLSLLNHL